MSFSIVFSEEWISLLSTVRRIERKIDLLTNMEKTEMADLTRLTADVTSNSSAVQSAVVLLQGLKAALDAAGTDPVALAALGDSLESSTAALSAAVVANTPAA